jgi:hypothetical protein
MERMEGGQVMERKSKMTRDELKENIAKIIDDNLFNLDLIYYDTLMMIAGKILALPEIKRGLELEKIVEDLFNLDLIYYDTLMMIAGKILALPEIKRGLELEKIVEAIAEKKGQP